MNIWHDTNDAPRTPWRVSPGEDVTVDVGTWPIEPGQSVCVTWEVTAADESRREGVSIAEWRRNTDVNSYWSVHLGPFADGDNVTYSISGSSSNEEVEIGPWRVRVRPALYVAWLWHQHQPLYRDPAAPHAAGSYRYPWVRLHGLRDYYSMPALAAEHGVKVTFNLTPVLLQQLDDYVLNGATDKALELTLVPAEDLSQPQIEELLSTFFDADWHNQVYIHPRYRELFEQRVEGTRFSRQDLRDLQMWFNLSWFGHEFRSDDVRLITGETVAVHGLVQRQRGFSHNDVLAMVESQYKILRAIVPLHRSLQEQGRIEVSTTPAFHPILPLVIDTDSARIDRPRATYPTRYAYPEDAAEQVTLACVDYMTRFGRRPDGMWPAEAAVSTQAVGMIADESIRWIATDAGVLERSGRWGYRTSEPNVLCRPYRAGEDAAPVAVFFRDTDLSDCIGFRYGQWTDAGAAAMDFVSTLESRLLNRLNDEEDHVLTIVLDGENAWGGYRDDGRPFLRALYTCLSSDQRLKNVTFAEYLRGNPERGIRSHPTSLVERVYDLATGSWIDEPSSARGVDLGTWIGEPEENLAWNLLGAARRTLATVSPDAPGFQRAHEALLASEGSDWFWWFGSDQESRNDAAFDDLFRAHLRGAYDALDRDAPVELDDFIVDHPVVWTFTHPVPTIRPKDRLSIRTNCPGRLAYRIDDLPEQIVSLAAVGGVMAGARRFQVTLGPFPEPARKLVFRFRCEHVGCEGGSACCLGGTQTIAFGRARGPRGSSTATTRVQTREGHAKH